ncbi:hypothetical protein AB0E96_30655, partial [Kitasatospora sp. NPDC036755]|uniref:hypothetical protein n=1 Tax=Kitasatospora sp. NPDC036755 TaxID=3154600 RepID=UPI0033CE821F
GDLVRGDGQSAEQGFRQEYLDAALTSTSLTSKLVNITRPWFGVPPEPVNKATDRPRTARLPRQCLHCSSHGPAPAASRS